MTVSLGGFGLLLLGLLLGPGLVLLGPALVLEVGVVGRLADDLLGGTLQLVAELVLIHGRRYPPPGRVNRGTRPPGIVCDRAVRVVAGERRTPRQELMPR